MATRIVCSLAGPEDGDEGKSMSVDVNEPFGRVLDLIIPLNNPSSALEARANLILTRSDGRQVFVRPEVVAVVLEDSDRDD